MASMLASRSAAQASCAGRVVMPSRRPAGARVVSRQVMVRAAQTIAAVETKDKKKVAIEKEEEEEEEYESPGLSPQQVAGLLSVLCDETEIAEVELKMGGFKLKVRRKLDAPAPVAVAHPAPVAAAPAAAPAAAASAPSPALSTQTLDEEDIRESLVIVSSPKVGIMRTARYVKGKKVGKGPMVQVGDSVKKGQVMYYVEQLGTYVAVEAPSPGEVVALLKEEGDAVEYGEDVAELMPFFGGHIIGDSKYM